MPISYVGFWRLTQIKGDFPLLATLSYICPMVKVLVTGPESSGKSYLVRHLSHHYNAPKVDEFAREFLSGKSTYNQTDLIRILEGQIQREEQVSSSKPPLVFCDTGPEVIQIWYKEKFGVVPDEIASVAQNHFYDLVLLCTPNIPWEFDPLRENSGDREYLFQQYLDFFEKLNMIPFVIDQEMNHRVQQAIEVINDNFPGFSSKF
jgi:nicotinamide riboside kinase